MNEKETGSREQGTKFGSKGLWQNFDGRREAIKVWVRWWYL